jgi:hypothetical protein
MTDDKRKPAAPAARIGGSADLMADDPAALKREIEAAEPHPQGAGGVDVADDTARKRQRAAKRRLARVLR